jgi:hypothetical protein
MTVTRLVCKDWNNTVNDPVIVPWTNNKELVIRDVILGRDVAYDINGLSFGVIHHR